MHAAISWVKVRMDLLLPNKVDLIRLLPHVILYIHLHTMSENTTREMLQKDEVSLKKKKKKKSIYNKHTVQNMSNHKKKESHLSL